MISRLRVRFGRITLSRQTRYALGGMGLVLVGVLIYALTRPSHPPNVSVVRRGRITATVEATGQVRAVREAYLSLRTSAQVRDVLVKPGQEVRAGDVLIRADATDAEKQVRDAELVYQIRQIEYDNLRSAPTSEQIEIARASLRRAAAALEAAQSAYDRAEAEGRAAGSQEAATLEAAKLDYETARANFEQAVRGPSADQLRIAEKNLELARLNLEAAKAHLADATITAPFAGTVVQIDVREGETAYGQKVVKLADLSSLEVVAQVDELDIAELAVGQEASIRLDALPGQVLQGHVARITPGATPQRGTVSYEVVIAFSPGTQPVRPDMTANLNITTLTHDDTLLVPSQAVEMRGRSRYVRVLEGGRVRDVRVTTGLADESETEVLEGLQEGQMVVVR